MNDACVDFPDQEDDEGGSKGEMNMQADAPCAMICGISGQDGAYLAQLLHSKGYKVIGTSRDVNANSFSGLAAVNVLGDVKLVSMAPNDFRSVLQAVSRHAPDEIYNLAGQTSVGLSFEQPVEAIESIAIGTLNLLEAIRFVARPIRFYNAGSTECFGDTSRIAAAEETPFRPNSPYAVAKVCAHNLVANYRQAYKLHASTGILCNHESPLRPERFVTQKIVSAAARIANGSGETLSLGNLEIHRDWGWAPEYVEAMWKMLQLENPVDLVIATGHSVSLEYFVREAFDYFGLAWRDHVVQSETLLRPSDIRYSAADASLARRVLDWQADKRVEGVIAAMCQAAAAKIGTNSTKAFQGLTT